MYRNHSFPFVKFLTGKRQEISLCQISLSLFLMQFSFYWCLNHSLAKSATFFFRFCFHLHRLDYSREYNDGSFYYRYMWRSWLLFHMLVIHNFLAVLRCIQILCYLCSFRIHGKLITCILDEWCFHWLCILFLRFIVFSLKKNFWRSIESVISPYVFSLHMAQGVLMNPNYKRRLSVMSTD